jgi:hypothetical protein
MMVMFQYKGKAYSFNCVDEVLLDMEQTLAKIDAGGIPEMPMTPREITDYLLYRKLHPDVES